MSPNIAFVHRFITSLVFTDIVETFVLIFLLTYVFKRHKLRVSEMIFAGLYASFSTITYVWFVIPYIWAWPTAAPAIATAELFAFVIEAIFYRWMLRLDWKTAFALSLICNAASYFLGPMLRSAGIWIYW